ncbi:lysine exporter LysO family protein, partial [Clostridiaceae bacterium HSG29]|nr:lysine exporter LysO family protein [Clostridiaceae bacterium HSG29]
GVINMLFTLIIIIAVFLGILTGHFFISPAEMDNLNLISSYFLTILLFSVGIDLGSSKDTFKDISKKSKLLFILTSAVILGTFTGGLIAGVVSDMHYNASLAIAAGFGWYSLAPVILNKIATPEIAAIAFLTNILREVFAIILIPILAKYVNFFTALAPGGATSMDTTLPIVSRATDPNHSVISFLNGAILTLLVPFLVNFLYSL